MIEKHIVLEDIDPVIFYGVNNANMQMIKALYPKLRIVARGNVIKVMGDEEEMCAFEESILALEKHCAQYNSLKEEVILDIVKGRKPQVEKDRRHDCIQCDGKAYRASQPQSVETGAGVRKERYAVCHRSGRFRQDLYRHCTRCALSEEQRNQENYSKPPGSGSR